jgi:hypothetical protein
VELKKRTERRNVANNTSATKRLTAIDFGGRKNACARDSPSFPHTEILRPIYQQKIKASAGTLLIVRNQLLRRYRPLGDTKEAVRKDRLSTRMGEMTANQ